DLPLHGQTCADGELYRLAIEHWQYPGHAEANRARLLIRISLKHRSAGAKQLRFGQQLRVHFQPDNALIFHTRVLDPPLPDCNGCSTITTGTHCNIAGVCAHAVRRSAVHTSGVGTGMSAAGARFCIKPPSSLLVGLFLWTLLATLQPMLYQPATAAGV